jgi:magnesium chelatase family protein
MAIPCKSARAPTPWSAATRRVNDTRRISGPLLDRIDLAKPTSRCRGWRRLCESLKKLSDDRLGEPSAAIRKRARRCPPGGTGVAGGAGVAAQRLAGTRMLANADMGPGEVRDFCRLDDVPIRQG